MQEARLRTPGDGAGYSAYSTRQGQLFMETHILEMCLVSSCQGPGQNRATPPTLAEGLVGQADFG